MDEMKMVDVYQCDECEGWFEQDGSDGLVAHIVNAHPQSAMARAICEVVGWPESAR